MKQIHTHYDDLKVSRNAPQEVIRAAYKSLSQKYHPDRNADANEAQRIMTSLNAAYETLSDPERRRAYDNWIAEEEAKFAASQQLKQVSSQVQTVRNKKSDATPMKLLFDLFPIILFFIAYKVFNIYVATTVAIAATVMQIAWTKWRHGKVDVMLWVSFVIIAVFGGATLMLHDATFIKLKPTVLYWLFSVILLFSNIFFNKNLMRALLQEKIALPLHIWHRVNLMWSLFFALLGIINLYVAFNFSEDAWVNFKLFGFTGLMLVFILAQSAWLAKYVDEKKESN